MTTKPIRRVGIVGYGLLGKYLAGRILDYNGSLELAFVWNRTPQTVLDDKRITQDVFLENLADFAVKRADLIIEVSHPSIVAEYGVRFLETADFIVGSPTALADEKLEEQLRQTALKGEHGLYVPSGALWGAADIKKMADRGSLGGVRVTMKKHPSSLKVAPELMKLCDACPETGEAIIYEGPVRALCPLAPNNVNTMACAAIAAHNLGFDNVVARLIADRSLKAHIIEIEVTGNGALNGFKVSTERYNPAADKAVTGLATYESFWSSLLEAKGRGNGVHMC